MRLRILNFASKKSIISSANDINIVQNKKHGFFHEIFKNRVLYLMFMPVGLFFILFSYVPMTGIIVAFKNYTFSGGIWGSQWCGFQNFTFLITSGKLWLVTRNTVLYNIAFLIAYTFFSVMLAVFISEIGSKWFKKFSQSFLLLPYFISWVVVSSLLYNFFSADVGLVNTFIVNLGFQKIDIYVNPNAWPFILVFVYVWKSIGYGSILYLSAIMGIDQDCYEAATIDGCNIYKKTRYITLPLLKPTIIILVLLALGTLLRGQFDMIYNLVGQNSQLFDITDNIDTLVFKSLMWSQNFGMASAGAFYQSVLCFVTIVIVNGIARTINKDYALF